METTAYYKTFQPSDKFLRSFIAYYYFDFSNVVKRTKKFIFYPHYKNALTVYKNSKVVLTPFDSVSTPDKNTTYSILYTGAESTPRTATIVSPFNKIGIVFQPIGINHFLRSKDSIQQILTPERKAYFNYFGSVFETTLDNIYKAESLEEKVALLDSFFSQHYSSFEEQRIKTAVKTLLENTDISITELAKKIAVSRKTLYRIFKKHTNCSVEEYKGIIKFRNVLEAYQEKESGTILTEIAHSGNYYDQSDFINHLKKVTGSTPKKFFSHLSSLGNEDTYWTILNAPKDK